MVRPLVRLVLRYYKMFKNLTSKLETIFSKLKNAPSLTEDQVDSGLKEIRLALLEADGFIDTDSN